MLPMIQNTSLTEEGHGSLLVLALLALIVGAAAGLVGAIFRLTLQQADRLRDALIAWAQGKKLAGFLIVVVTCATAAFIAAWLVRRFAPHASGSGVPHAIWGMRRATRSIEARIYLISFRARSKDR